MKSENTLSYMRVKNVLICTLIGFNHLSTKWLQTPFPSIRVKKVKILNKIVKIIIIIIRDEKGANIDGMFFGQGLYQLRLKYQLVIKYVVSSFKIP